MEQITFEKYFNISKFMENKTKDDFKKYKYDNKIKYNRDKKLEMVINYYNISKEETSNNISKYIENRKKVGGCQRKRIKIISQITL